MTKEELLENLKLIELLLNDIPKKYKFLDEVRLKESLNIVIKEINHD